MPSAVLVANIIGKRNNTEDNDDLVRTDQPEFEYFVNDGIFQSFTMHLLVPYVKPVAKVSKINEKKRERRTGSVN